MFEHHGKTYVASDTTQFHGILSVVGGKTTITLSPTIELDLQTFEADLGTLFIVINCAASREGSPELSEYAKNQLARYGLKKGYDADRDIYILGSNNGWCKDWHMGDFAETLGKDAWSIVQTDNWGGFHSPANYIDKLISNDCVPCMYST